MKRLLFLSLALAYVGLFLGALAWNVPLCPWATLFGLPCPSCGLTRAALALLAGDVRGALAHHPLVFVLPPSIVVAFALGASAPDATNRPRLRSMRRAALLALGVVGVLTLLVWVARFGGYFGGPAVVDHPRLHEGS